MIFKYALRGQHFYSSRQSDSDPHYVANTASACSTKHHFTLFALSLFPCQLIQRRAISGVCYLKLKSVSRTVIITTALKWQLLCVIYDVKLWPNAKGVDTPRSLFMNNNPERKVLHAVTIPVSPNSDDLIAPPRKAPTPLCAPSPSADTHCGLYPSTLQPVYGNSRQAIPPSSPPPHTRATTVSSCILLYITHRAKRLNNVIIQ